MTTPGDIIKKRRDALGLTQTALSKQAKVHLNTLRDIEAKGGAKSSFLPQLARALGIDIYALVNGELSTIEDRPSNPESGAASPGGKLEAARAMSLVDEIIGQIAPVLQSAAREEFQRWLSGEHTREQASAILDALLNASKSLPASPPGLLESPRAPAKATKKNVT